MRVCFYVPWWMVWTMLACVSVVVLGFAVVGFGMLRGFRHGLGGPCG